jgi:hypothetical protein
VVRAATDAELRARLAAAGRERARGFTWARTAELADREIERLLRADRWQPGRGYVDPE